MTGGCDCAHVEQIHTLPSAYLKSPLLVLSQSIEDSGSHFSIHDLLDAYCTLFHRVETICGSTTDDNATTSQLHAIKECSTTLARRIRCDIRLALEDSYTKMSPSPINSPFTAVSMSTSESHEDFAFTARDSSALCQQSLKFASLILRFPQLHQFFTPAILSQLIVDILAVARSCNLPSYDSGRTRALASWVFAGIRIPCAIMSLSKAAVVRWIGDLVSDISPTNSWSKILHHLWSEYPALYLHDTTNALSEVLSLLVSFDSAVRAHALIALSGFSCGMLSLWSSAQIKLKAATLKQVRTFLFDEQLGPPTGIHLPHILRCAIEETTSHAGPRWAIAVICCLVLLSGHGVFASGRFAKLIGAGLEKIANRKKTGDELLVCGWRTLIWAFSQIPRDHRRQPNTRAAPGFGNPSMRHSAFQIVKQELRGGLGICLVASLLFAQPKDLDAVPDPDLVRVASVLKEMVSHYSEEVYLNGVVVLEKLVGTIGTAEEPRADLLNAPWSPDDLPIKALFSRCLLDADGPAFCKAMRKATRVSSSAIRPLHEQEIQNVWTDLLEVWAISVRREIQKADFTELSNSLVQVWQALLLVQTHLTQEKAHLTSSPEWTNSIVSVVAGFLDWSQLSDAKYSPLSTGSMQRRVLALCCQLWGLMENVFSDLWLASASTLLLGKVIRHTFDLYLDDVKVAWSKLCSLLVSANNPDPIVRLVEESEECLIDIRRGLWLSAAETWTSRDPTPRWTESVDFLVLPLRYWAMNQMNLSIWDSILTHAVSQALSVSEPSLVVFDAIVDRAFKAPIMLSKHPKAFLHILSSFNLYGEICETSVFLRGVDSAICDLYTDMPENILTATHALAQLRRILQGCPTNAILSVFSCWTKSMALWIGDEAELLLVQEYNDVVIPLYCTALDALRKITFSADTLHVVAPFLCSAFVRIPEPGRGPLAFCEFWKDVQPSLALLHGAYPEGIRSALKASHDVLGLDIPTDMDYTDGSSSSWTSPARPTGEESYMTPGRTSPLRGSTSHVSAEAAPPTTRTSAYNSDYMPSSPTDALRARRLAAGLSRIAHERPKAISDRPVKRFKTELQKASLSDVSEKPSDVQSSAATSGDNCRSEWRFDGVEVPTFKGFKRNSTKPYPKEPIAEPRSPSVPSPAVATGAARSSDDYDAWEVPVCEDGVVPDSQPSGDEGSDDSMLPSFMKELEGQQVGVFDDDPVSADDKLVPSSKVLGKRPQFPSRMRTAPASVLGLNIPSAGRGPGPSTPVKRANTAFAQLEGLQNVYDMLVQNGSQLDAEEIAAASALTHRIGTLLSEQLSKKLRSGGSGYS